MKLQNEFRVPLPPDEAWDLLLDVERVAPCFPGAKLLEIHDDGSFVGTVSVRLGPVAMTFKGDASYQEVDADNRRVRAKARGNEQRNRGTASANVEFNVAPDGDGTKVTIDTDLQLAGSVAQYARGAGMIEATAQVMIDDFAETLKGVLDRDRVAEEKQAARGPGLDAAAPQPPAAEEPASEPAPQAAPQSENKPPSLIVILWRALKRWLFGSGR